MKTRTAAVVLAAGQGTRMKSGMPKVLHRISGLPLVHFPVQAALDAGCHEVVVVVGHGREAVEAYLSNAFGDRVKTAVQVDQKGTGDAVAAGLTGVSSGIETVVVYYGDVPLLEAQDVAAVVHAYEAGATEGLGLAVCEVDDPFGYGRILRDDRGRVFEVREQRDLKTDAERAIREINPGIYASSVGFMKEAVHALEPNNAQGELYLTDIVKAAYRGERAIAVVQARADVLLGVNDRSQLAEADRRMQSRIVERWRKSGVTIREGARVEALVELAPDCEIEVHVVLRGKTKVGTRTRIDVGSVLTDVRVGDDVTIKPYSVMSESTVGSRAQIGPFSHLRPASSIGDEAHVGNFVETKKTTMGKGSKANHLAYLGDGIVGERANIGAGTIFCNYDGFMKHTTTIGDEAFIGSDSQLVAPVRIGKGAYVGTGTTVTLDVPDDALAIGRARQANKDGYASRLRAKLKAEKAAKTSG